MQLDQSRPIVFGEVLFDRFPDGSAVLGGAPFNVAWHLQGFGLHPLFVSRIGNDEAGGRVLAAMTDWGMDISGVQIDDDHPTGAVEIRFGTHGHSFEILSDQAYDYIDPTEASCTAGAPEGALLYHGSLALRGRLSRAALDQVRSANALPAFVDINLRAPWWDDDHLLELLAGATWLKLSDEELAIFAGLVGAETDDGEAMARTLADRFAIDLVIVTLGPEGAMAIERDGDTLWAAPEETIRVVDTVGAGDAFAAVVILGLMHGWPLPLVLGRAQSFAGVVCGWRGATHQDRAIYAGQLALWEDDDAQARG